MAQLEPALVDKVANTCLDLYNKLPKTGKPTANEWTVLSCMVKHEKDGSNIEVVSLGTGSKCIGASKMSPKGDILNDSHAEVMARRGFLLYLYDQIEQVIAKKPSIFIVDNDQYTLRKKIDFLFYSSQLPCGDASIIPKTGDQEHFGDVIKSQKRTADSDICATDSKTIKISEDTHRTGAKCLPDAVQDPKNSGLDYHLYGQVRTKPGRGDRTLSVSCSDKLARWTHVGIQGSLLHMLLVEPIFVKHYIFGASVPYSKESLTRAFLERKPGVEMMTPFSPHFYQSSITFPHIRSEENLRPVATSIVWIKKDIPLIEVAVQGKKLGVTKKNINELSSALSISKVHLYTKFLQILNQNLDLKQTVTQEETLESVPYNEMKKKSRRYVEKWLVVREQFFRKWTVKPDMWGFRKNYAFPKKKKSTLV